MKCKYCGAIIPDGVVYCEVCGKEVQIVPDYNPLEDVLTAHVKGSVYEQEQRRNTYYDNTRVYARQGSGYIARQRALREQREREEKERQRAMALRSAENMRTENAGLQKESRLRKEKRRARQQAKRKRRMIFISVTIAAVTLTAFLLYYNSYTGYMQRANRALNSSEYEEAIIRFEKAIHKNEKRPEAYTGLANVYLAKDDESEAEEVFKDAVERQPDNAQIYRAFLAFLENTKQPKKIPVILDECGYDSVLEALPEYYCSAPTYSLDKNAYDEVQELALDSDGNTIYYTLDGSEPTTSSTKYSEPIQIGEGETTVNAVAINKRGIPSLSLSRTYTVELPVEDAPAVKPSSGRYTKPTQISMIVPEGYEAYYALNVTEFTKDSPEAVKYTGPIDMPEGNTIFSAILVNSRGKASDITIRNYELQIIQ